MNKNTSNTESAAAVTARAQHTPGPWAINRTLVDGAWARFHIAGRKHGSIYPICEKTFETGEDVEVAIADAHLIAAAPELLGALKDVSNYLWGSTDQVNRPAPDGTLLGSVLKQASAAISRAEGRQ
jgi:hypothetical protein